MLGDASTCTASSGCGKRISHDLEALIVARWRRTCVPSSASNLHSPHCAQINGFGLSRFPLLSREPWIPDRGTRLHNGATRLYVARPAPLLSKPLLRTILRAPRDRSVAMSSNPALAQNRPACSTGRYDASACSSNGLRRSSRPVGFPPNMQSKLLRHSCAAKCAITKPMA